MEIKHNNTYSVFEYLRKYEAPLFEHFGGEFNYSRQNTSKVNQNLINFSKCNFVNFRQLKHLEIITFRNIINAKVYDFLYLSIHRSLHIEYILIDVNNIILKNNSNICNTFTSFLTYCELTGFPETKNTSTNKFYPSFNISSNTPDFNFGNTSTCKDIHLATLKLQPQTVSYFFEYCNINITHLKCQLTLILDYRIYPLFSF